MEVSRTEQQQVVERFVAAVSSGDIQGLMDVLAPDVVLIADGGGEVLAFRRPVEGIEQVATALSGLKRIAPEAVAATMWLNGSPAVRVDQGDKLDTVVSLAVENGRITRIFAIRNPHKLGHVSEELPLSRN
jgi:RNA polymerase sigma-70 factor (ECF subfamily)